MRSVWKCACKVGTTIGTVAYFFEKPVVGKVIECVPITFQDTMHRRAIRMYIDEVREDGFVFCSYM